MTQSDYAADDWLGLEWRDWAELDPAAGSLAALPTEPGLYRVRHLDRDGLTYIGETGRSLRGRVRALARGTYDDDMPYRDPHTAAPCLWAIRDQDGPAFEVSVAAPAVATDTQQRKAMEDALIARYRRAVGESPTANFGRIIPGYRQSSYRRDGQTGGPLPEGAHDAHAAADRGPLHWTDAETPTAATWMGLEWTAPRLLSDADSSLPDRAGVYRIWRPGEAPPPSSTLAKVPRFARDYLVTAALVMMPSSSHTQCFPIMMSCICVRR